MHAYCIEVLHLSEPETALRIHVARASRKHPMLLEMLRDGRIHLSGIALAAALGRWEVTEAERRPAGPDVAAQLPLRNTRFEPSVGPDGSLSGEAE